MLKHAMGMFRSLAFGRFLFLVPALLWLPAGIVVFTLVRGIVPPMDAGAWLQLAATAPCGLPLALAWQRLRRLRPPAVAVATARLAMALLALLTVAAVVIAGLWGPMAMAVVASVVSLPAWALTLRAPRRR